VDYCRSQKGDAVLSRIPDETLPEVGGLAYMIQGICNSLQEELSALEEDILFGEIDDEERDRRADESFNKECIIAELLKIAVNVDYADEIGRRSMYALVRE
jgi:condensin complex subunit 3